MINIESLKSKYNSIDKIIILDLQSGDNFVYYKMQISFINKSSLYVNEYNSVEERKYSYHWQDHEDNLLIRWDNAPHHEDISTHPHHKHENKIIYASEEISLDDILTFIDNQISTN